MITEQEIIAFMKEEAYHPLTVHELEEAFQIQSADDLKKLVKLLNVIEESGQIVRTRSNRYGVPERLNLVRGKLQGHAKGFGFVIPEQDGIEDIFIPAHDTNGALNGDIILCRVSKTKGGSRLEGEISRIIERAPNRFVGTYSDQGDYGFVLVDDKRFSKDVFIPKSNNLGAVEGHKVIASIVKYSKDGRTNPEGEIIEIIGHKNDPGVDILSIIHKYGLSEHFTPESLQETETIPTEISAEDIVGRRDLRGKPIVTIDGADAKDLDDGISLEKLDNGNYQLGVHIADVSYYVKEGTALDEEAYYRGTSVYLVDRVIPMIPHRLSNGICSLNPQEDRLTITCEMEFNHQDLSLAHYEIYTSVIHSKERMTYSDLYKIIEENDEQLSARYSELTPMFHLMKELALSLRKKRIDRGAIDFDFQESKVLVDEEGHPTDIVLRDQTVAEQIIEEFMLAANETVAEHFHWLHQPFIYRTHEDPDEGKLQTFLEFITNFGFMVKGTAQDIHPRALQTLLEQVKGEPEEAVISKVMLRSMKQAKYTAEHGGHFGLSTEYYTHFTSPIRRYPDLIVHRLIRDWIEKGPMDDGRKEAWEARLPDVARHTSERERVAVDAERETDDMKKAEYMADKIGEEFEGIISSVTNFGMFVELPNTVEGLVHMSFMQDDYYNFDERNYALVGERTKKTFRIGDVVNVRVISVNKDEHTVDFEVVGMAKRAERTKRKAPVVIQGGKKQQKQADAVVKNKKDETKPFWKEVTGSQKKKNKKRRKGKKRV